MAAGTRGEGGEVAAVVARPTALLSAGQKRVVVAVRGVVAAPIPVEEVPDPRAAGDLAAVTTWVPPGRP
jgi:hypothetical protein